MPHASSPASCLASLWSIIYLAVRGILKKKKNSCTPLSCLQCSRSLVINSKPLQWPQGLMGSGPSLPFCSDFCCSSSSLGSLSSPNLFLPQAFCPAVSLPCKIYPPFPNLAGILPMLPLQQGFSITAEPGQGER